MVSDDILYNPTLYSKALTPAELAKSFKWHNYAWSPKSSQVFCISAFGTLRNLAVGNQVLANLLYEAFPETFTQGRSRKWMINLEAEDEGLLNERGTRQPTSIDALCTSSREVVCVESKFITDAADGFGRCSQAVRGDCAGYRGPGSDSKTKTSAWCRLESWDGGRSPRLYWSFGKTYFRPEIFEQQLPGQTCPFSGPFYQLLRNFLFAAAMAERDRKKSFGVLAICPEPTSGSISQQVEEFRQQVLLPEFRDCVKFLPYETLIDHLRNVADSEADELAAFLEERIRTVYRKDG